MEQFGTNDKLSWEFRVSQNRSWSSRNINKLYKNKSNKKAMNRNWSNQKANPALKTKEGNK